LHRINIIKPGITLVLAENTVICKIKNRHKDADVRKDKEKPPPRKSYNS
jgi:hypothetical protein